MMKKAVALFVMLCGVMWAVNSFALERITYISSPVYLAGNYIPQGGNGALTAGSIIAALPSHQVIVTDNMGNFYKVAAPSGWDRSMGEKIVWFTTAIMEVHGVQMQGSVSLGSMHWFDVNARQNFNNTFGIAQ